MTPRPRHARPPAGCYDVPAWHRTLWGEHAAGSHDARALASFGDERAAGFGEGFLPELFHRLYAETPAELPDPGPAAAVRRKLHALASELPELGTLRRQTVRSDAWAGLGATVLGESVARALPELASDPPDADRAGRILDGMRALAGAGAADASSVASAEGAALGAGFAVGEQAAGLDESTLRRALRAGIADAEAAIEQARAACAALGYGEGAGDSAGAPDMATAMELARTVAGSDKLARIVALAGRLTATARAKRASRTRYARSEVVGVEPTRELARILPSEMVALASPLRTADLVRRLGERAALGYAMRGREREAKGPIVALLDVSGSMRDDGRDEWSKAVALALLDAARHDRRAFGVCLFNGSIVDTLIASDPRKADPAALLALLSRGCSGGTAFAPPIDQALAWIGAARGEGRGALRRADVVLITDGRASDGDAPAKRKALADLGAHVFGIAIGTPAAGLAPWTDEATAIDDVSRDGAAVDLVFDRV